MRIGKILSLIAGIITLLATFLLSWYSIDEGGITIYYAGGLGIIKNLPAMFTDAQGLGTTLGIPLEISQFAFFFLDLAIVEGFLPLNIAIGDASLGTILVLVGGVLGLIGAIMGPD